MKTSTSYRLSEYKITENESGFLFWETHCGLGSCNRGQCFIRGNILFIEFSDIIDNGFLKLEFIEEIEKLKKWGKTEFYCSNYKILSCKNGHNTNVLELLTQSPSIEKNQTGVRDSISYKLGRYEIKKQNNSNICWKSHRRHNIYKSGKCFIEGGILFIGAAEIEKTGPTKKEFIRHLSQLPHWIDTDYYCSNYSLYHCENARICRFINETEKGIKRNLKNRKEKNTKNTYNKLSSKNDEVSRNMDFNVIINNSKKVCISTLSFLKNCSVRWRKK
ncbi:Uncharacterized protein dnl_00160 [Desulfonema limicola]|uniref:Uncharacterized protein n=1 Tax=Desulfonema limicola TaxID=45656 RepID=A0A975GE74_9BACT|nr:hypothetical protein [Desulfonema limicola]QTA77819.1 Uncharacterized protein dnl_00160 [Desulfonema limicola]